MVIMRRQAAVVAALASAVGLFLWWYGNKHDFFDLKIYISAMRWWQAGHPLYEYSQPDPVQGRLYFTYPPFTALLLWPFGYLPIGATITIFTAGTVAALALTTWWLVAPVADQHGWSRWFAMGIALPFAFAVEPTRETITFGQLNMLLVVLILADMLIALPRNAWWGGIGIGLATAIKLYPGIFLVYLLATRRWRASATACAVAGAATVIAAVIAPDASWEFWTEALWSTERVGRTDYTGNQSVLGLLSRLVAPDQPTQLFWLSLAIPVGVFGLWRAARAIEPRTALTLTGLTGALVSPITWPHHLYWLIPAVVVLVDRGGRWLWLAGLSLAIGVFGVVSFVHWGVAPVPTDSLGEFLGRNAEVLLCLLLVAALPATAAERNRPRRAQASIT